MDEIWEEIGFVISSSYRLQVIQRLAEGPATPSQIASDIDTNISHVSRTLQQLQSRSMAELLVPEERRKGRVYAITDAGRTVWKRIQAENLA